MFADEGDELLIGQTEYIVLNRYNEEGKEYLFVANILNPDENIVDNFDTDAVKLLLLSQENLINNTYKKEYIDENFLNTYISDDNFGNFDEYIPEEEVFEEEILEEDYSLPNTVIEEENEQEDKKTTKIFNVEKYLNKLERILEIMFLE